MVDELTVDQVRKVCDPQSLGFKTTGEIEPREGIIGQSRALQALQFGLDIADQGYNVYVAGSAGTGRTTAVQAFLQERARHQEVPVDWCYVNNFQDSYRPRALKLPAGQGRALQGDVKTFIDRARHSILQTFESEEYGERREAVESELEQEQQALFQPIRKRAQEAGFLLEVTQMGMAFIPLEDGQPLNQEAFRALDADARQDMEKRRDQLQDELKSTLRELRNLSKDLQERIKKLNRDVVLFAVDLLVEELLEKYRDLPDVTTYLHMVQEDILGNIDLFRSSGDKQEENKLQAPWMEDMPFRKYEVNVIVDNSECAGAPVVIERNPTYPDLFGRIEKESQFGALHTDFTLVQGGSLHRANGGYLVLPVEELLRNLYVWDGLKRAVRNGEIAIEEVGERLGYISTRGLRPEPIPLDVKIVLIGNPRLYHLLYQLDEDFNELFKVKADFDTRMDRTPENIRDYLASVARMCRAGDHLCLDCSAAARLIEHSSRLADDQDKLSTHFAEVADLIREANFWAAQDGASYIENIHIRKAIEERVYRSNLIQERIQELVQRGTLLIDTEGERVGQINGLAVLSLGDYAFGRPSRITVSMGLGRGGIVDIEREAQLGGPIHTKGVLILSGYLMQQYAQDKTLSLSARLVFEQSYEGIEGDSASSTELYALLSALSALPIRQDIAVTGSLNQQGQVQAIGGANEKVEGFFEICKSRGLSGQQGVMLPHSNVQNLMLKEEVVEAVGQGHFHIWPVRTIDEGIEILTGVPAGERDANGKFPLDTVHGLVDWRLRELAQSLRGPN